MEEIWKDVKGYEGLYKVSNLGRFIRLTKNSEHLLKTRIDGNYYRVTLYKNGIPKQFRVHRILAINFIDNSLNKPFINHKDGNPLNNDLSNLEWCTHSENVKHAYDNGLIDIVNKSCDKGTPNILKNEDVIEIRNLFGKETVTKIAKQFNVSREAINNIKFGRAWKRLV